MSQGTAELNVFHTFIMGVLLPITVHDPLSAFIVSKDTRNKVVRFVTWCAFPERRAFIGKMVELIKTTVGWI